MGVLTFLAAWYKLVSSGSSLHVIVIHLCRGLYTPILCMTNPEYVQLLERSISGSGVVNLTLSNSPQGKVRRDILVYVDVVRPPKSEYQNRKYIPYRGRYATVQFVKNDYVYESRNIEYRKQLIRIPCDYNYQHGIQLSCVNQEILQSIANLATALNLNVISIENETKNWASLLLTPDYLQFVCDTNEALRVQVWALEYNKCQELNSPIPPPPPEPPQPTEPPTYTPGTPLSSDWCQDIEVGGVCNPNPLDTPTPPPPPVRTCEVYSVTLTGYVTVIGSGERINFTFTRRVYGQVVDYGFDFDGTTTSLFILCYGQVDVEECQQTPKKVGGRSYTSTTPGSITADITKE